MSDLDAALSTFAQEAKELLINMEEGLLILEDTPDDSETINSIFRAMHTIKGSSGLFGFNAIVSFTHEAETVLDKVRNGERPIDAALISTLLGCKDHTEQLLEFILEQPDSPLPDELEQNGQMLIQELTGVKASPKSNSSLSESQTKDSVETIKGKSISEDNWLISLDFQKDALRNGMDPLSFIRYLKTLGDIQQIITQSPNLPHGEAMDPESCYLQFRILFKSDADKQTIENVFEFAADDCDIKILPPDSKVEHYLALLNEQPDNQLERLGDMLIKTGAVTQNDIAKALHNQSATPSEDPQAPTKPIGEILVEQKVVQQPIVAEALKKQEQTRQKIATDANFIRVDSKKLGHLINLVGELVISGAAMNLMVERHGLSDVEEIATGMSTLISDIRDTALELRMVQIGETFSRFRRVVRDVSKELNKDIELTITGGETELDKTVVEKINDPLTHLIRNSLDHGIETPEERMLAGKPAKGNITLNAFHDSGHIVIQVQDDGAGLDEEKIIAKAIKNGLIKSAEGMSRQEIFNLIFAAGLSTKQQANNLSGRGVGMDVVKRNIEALRGTVNIDSEKGQGSTITIHLPLTLAIIDGFMVETEQERYIIPLNMVEECVEMEEKQWEIDTIQNYINLRGEVMPYLRLGDYFHNRTRHQKHGRESLVVVRSGQNRAGFVVDELLGEHQTVIKPLGKVFQTLEGITGATVLGDGNVALILDVQGLVKKATDKMRRASSFLTMQ